MEFLKPFSQKGFKPSETKPSETRKQGDKDNVCKRNDKGNERYIEVKTTVCKKSSCRANIFYISNNEYSKYISNRRKYKIYRVYDIDGSPEFEEIDLEMTNKEPNGFIVSY